MKLIPFDIEKAKAGAKVVTRNGHDVRILAYDVKSDYSIIAAIKDKFTFDEDVESYTTDGRFCADLCSKEDDRDLMIQVETKTRVGYVIVDRDKVVSEIFDNKEHAENRIEIYPGNYMNLYIAKITWEEEI